MKIAAAQINCTVGRIQDNLNEHYRIIRLAMENNVCLITFPEMSITGYCRAEGESLAFTTNDNRLDRLQELSNSGNIVIIAGAPIKTKGNLYIGSFIISPDKPVEIYTKQHLHDGEEVFYTSSMDHNPIIHLESEIISLAICADINNEDHPHQAALNRATIYLPSIFYSPEGLETGYRQLSNYSRIHSLNILMSNYSGELWDTQSGGKSAFWDTQGMLVGHLSSDESGMLIAERIDDKWNTHRVVSNPGVVT